MTEPLATALEALRAAEKVVAAALETPEPARLATDANTALLLRELERDEGRRRKPYRCTADKLSIGLGRNLEDVGLSDDEIDYLALNDVARVRADLDKNAPWWRELDPVRQRVVQNMCFNLGWPRLAKFKDTLTAMKARRWDAAADGMLDSLWARQVGDRAKRLARMMRTGAA